MLPLYGSLSPLAASWRKPAPDAWYLTAGVVLTDVVGAYAAKGAASQAASYINLATPGTYDLTAPVAPGWSATDGWLFTTLTTQRLVFSPGSQALQAATSIVRVNVTSQSVSLRSPAFAPLSGSSYSIIPNFSQGSRAYASVTAQVQVAPALMGMHTMAIAGVDCYTDGVNDATLTAGSGAFSSLLLGNISTLTRSFQGNILEYVFYNKILTPTQVADISSKMAAR